MEFSNRWIHTLDPEGDLSGENPIKLPASWRNAAGDWYSNLQLLSVPALNNIGWYKIMVDKPVINEYEENTISDISFNALNDEIEVIYVKSYKDLTEVRNIKIRAIHNAKIINIQTTLDDRTKPENFQVIFKSLSLLIHAFSQANPQTYVNNNTYLQAVMSQSSILENETIIYNNKIAQVNIETDIPTIIAL